MKVIPYISFKGNCEAAVSFYQSILGGELNIIRFKDLPEEESGDYSVSKEWEEKIMHCLLSLDNGALIYFGDTWENTELITGTNSAIHLNVDSEKEVYKFVEQLSKEGEVTMEADKVFWGSVYGSVIDKFGIQWGIEFQLPSE